MSIHNPFLNKLLSISLKWKLLIPFLFFAFSGTTLLTLIGLTSQQNLIKKEEKEKLQYHYRYFLERIAQKEDQSISLASMVSENPLVQKMLAQRDRKGLIDLLGTTFERMRDDFGIKQFHFHIPPATSFLRLHKPEDYGEDIGPTRKTVLDALTKGQKSFGLEKGATGLGMRGVVPVFYEGKIAGSIEIGLSLGDTFLNDFKNAWNVDISLYEIKGTEGTPLIAFAGETMGPDPVSIDYKNIKEDNPVIFISPEHFPSRSFLFGPLKDYSGDVVALIRLSADRSEIIDKLTQTRNVMFLVGLGGILISFVFTYLVIAFLIRPIKELVREAKDIALGKRESRLDPKPGDETGTLTQALNTMLEALKRRRVEIEDYAKTLEKRVQERTSDLVISEEKYRTLVENVPLIVYRVLRDGTTEFVNSYMTERLGYSIEEAVGDKRFWRDKISGEDLSTFNSINSRCFKNAEECKVESRVRAKDGRVLDFLTHAIPTKDSNGRVLWVDGILMDITELKKLQERELQSEEMRTLGEISARMAHEIRNPLSAVGGFARRLEESLDSNDKRKKIAGIIVEEVEKLENFLGILLASIKPFDLKLSNVDISVILRSCMEGLKDIFDSRNIELIVTMEPNLPEIEADPERLEQAFATIIKHAIIESPKGGKININAKLEENNILILIVHNIKRLTDDDLDKFFFPHTEDVKELDIQDLPLSKIIIHRHGGIINIYKKEDKKVEIRIEFPIANNAGTDNGQL